MGKCWSNRIAAVLTLPLAVAATLNHGVCDAAGRVLVRGVCKIDASLDTRFASYPEYAKMVNQSVKLQFDAAFERESGPLHASALTHSFNQKLPYQKKIPISLDLALREDISTSSHSAFVWKNSNLWIQFNVLKRDLNDGRLTGACMVIFGPNNNPPIWGKFSEETEHLSGL